MFQRLTTERGFQAARAELRYYASDIRPVNGLGGLHDLERLGIAMKIGAFAPFSMNRSQ